MAESSQEKTEPATPRRRRESRQEGQVARSPDLTAACVLLASMLLLNLFGGNMMAGLKRIVEAMLSGSLVSHPAQVRGLGALPAFGGTMMTKALLPLIVGVAVVALLATVMQVGLLLTAKPLQPKLSKLSPIRGLQQLFSGRGAVRLIMSLAKVAIISGMAIIVVNMQMPQILKIGELDVRPICTVSWSLLYSLGLKLALLLIVLAVLDYAYQRRRHEKDIRMTKEDVKEEMKRMDGDPLVKQRRSRVARQLAMQRIAQAVPKADVVVTNPTHFAVALRYDAATMSAPKVVAKGADYMAMRIRQLALANEVPLVERKSLARGLYQAVEVGQEVPPQFFSAVAEILAYVYRLSGTRVA